MRAPNLRRKLVIIDDDRIFCKAASRYFGNNQLEVFTAHTGAEGLDLCSRERADVLLLDQKLPDSRGVDLCTSILSHNDQTKIIFITAYPSFDNAVEAVKAGAYDYLSKPFDMNELELAIDRALQTLDLQKVEQIQDYKSKKESEETVLVGKNSGLAEVFRLVQMAASSSASVLITGETGTGKSVVAKLIHYRSAVGGIPFLHINCSALPESLIESELFGHEKGAFTGAVEAKKGIFEMADGGTLFLDEIGSLSHHLQSKLLGVLDEKKIKRIGGQSVKPIEVRIIAATNLDIEEAVAEKTFREDLYYRLSVVRIPMPPLRERLRDIPDLCYFFMSQLSRDSEVKLPDEEVEKLKEYHWPGNVRELRNVIERSIILRKGAFLRPSELIGSAATDSSLTSCVHSYKGTPPSPLFAGLKELISMEELERNYIRHALAEVSGNRTKAARSLGISRATLLRKIKAYGLK